MGTVLPLPSRIVKEPSNGLIGSRSCNGSLLKHMKLETAPVFRIALKHLMLSEEKMTGLYNSSYVGRSRFITRILGRRIQEWDCNTARGRQPFVVKVLSPLVAMTIEHRPLRKC